MNNECKGCIEYRVKSCNLDVVPQLSKTEKCPCMTCLVKGICEDACEDYVRYRTLCNDKKRLNKGSFHWLMNDKESKMKR